MLTGQWEATDWVQVKNYVNWLQTRIAKATVKGDKNRVKRLQYLLTHSFYSKSYAVKKVTSNKGNNPPKKLPRTVLRREFGSNLFSLVDYTSFVYKTVRSP